MPKTPSDPNIVSSSQKRKAEVLPPKPEKKRPGRPPLSQTQQVTPKSVSIVYFYSLLFINQAHFVYEIGLLLYLTSFEPW